MFDLDRSGSINMYEFSALFKYINDWKALFERIDRDRSGFIEDAELRQGKMRGAALYTWKARARTQAPSRSSVLAGSKTVFFKVKKKYMFVCAYPDKCTDCRNCYHAQFIKCLFLLCRHVRREWKRYN